MQTNVDMCLINIRLISSSSSFRALQNFNIYASVHHTLKKKKKKKKPHQHTKPPNFLQPNLVGGLGY